MRKKAFHVKVKSGDWWWGVSKDKAIIERAEQSANVNPNFPNVNWKQIC